MTQSMPAAILCLACLAAPASALAAEASTPPVSSPAASSTPPSVSVEGVATVPISLVANQAEANAVYRQGLTAAIADGHGKAEFLAAATGAKVGAIQQIVERGGSIECFKPTEPAAQEEYVPPKQSVGYLGVQPDFGSVELGSVSRVYAAPPVAAPSLAPAPARARRRKHRRHRAKTADATTCTLSTQVVLSYLLM